MLMQNSNPNGMQCSVYLPKKKLMQSIIDSVLCTVFSFHKKSGRHIKVVHIRNLILIILFSENRKRDFKKKKNFNPDTAKYSIVSFLKLEIRQKRAYPARDKE